MAKILKTITATLDENRKWEVKIDCPTLPLSGHEAGLLLRAVKVAHKLHIREYNRKQYALRNKAKAEEAAKLTGQSQLVAATTAKKAS